MNNYVSTNKDILSHTSSCCEIYCISPVVFSYMYNTLQKNITIIGSQMKPKDVAMSLFENSRNMNEEEKIWRKNTIKSLSKGRGVSVFDLM